MDGSFKDRGPTWILKIEEGTFSRDTHPDDMRDHSLHLCHLMVQSCIRRIYYLIGWHTHVHRDFELGMIESYVELAEAVEPLVEWATKWKERLDANRPECRRTKASE